MDYQFILERFQNRNQKFEDLQKSIIESDREIPEDEISDIVKKGIPLFTIEEIINFSKYLNDSDEEKDSEESVIKLLDEWITKNNI